MLFGCYGGFGFGSGSVGGCSGFGSIVVGGY